MLWQVCGGEEDTKGSLLIFLDAIALARRVLKDLQNKHKENYKKAYVICPKEEVEALGGCHGSTPEQLSAELSRLIARQHCENQRHPKSFDDLKMKFAKRDRKISKKRRTYVGFREKLDGIMYKQVSSVDQMLMKKSKQ
eukprot:Gb_10884 [translate_table: standard]